MTITSSGKAERHAKHLSTGRKRMDLRGGYNEPTQNVIQCQSRTNARSDQKNGLGMKAERCLNR
ncbi:hypothetical protein [Rhodopirellula europaea]|nr:hypothetical protein [Rhodopirellula europaea]